MKLGHLVFLLFISIYSSFSVAARLKSFCTLDENTREIKGQSVEERLPIASVSKLFTSLLTVSTNDIRRKIYTQFFYTPVSSDVYDVHIKGAHEPYFSRQALHWLIAKLNEAGVYKIRNLTFDQNLKYYHDTNQRARVGRIFVDPVTGKTELEAPSPDLVKAQLMQNAEVLKYYESSAKEALANGVQLPKKIVFHPERIRFLPAENFTAASETKKGYLASPDILHMLKLMNWNSNNHAANQFFNYSGGLAAFNKLFYDQFGIRESELKFVNGSGQNADMTGDSRIYNEATCSVVVRTVKALKAGLEAQKVHLQDAVSVMGGDVGSTVAGATYTNPMTNLSVIAKTGTVGTNVTLAGMISSKTGNHFFFFNVEVNSPPARLRNKNSWMNAEAARARKMISMKLNDLVKKFGGPSPIDYKVKTFNLENFEEADFQESPEAHSNENQ